MPHLSRHGQSTAHWFIGASLMASVLISGCASSEEPVVLVDSAPLTALVSVAPGTPSPKPADTPADTPSDAITEPAGTTQPSEIAPSGEPSATGSLEASVDGLGEARFGDNAQDTIGYFAEQFGPPSGDTGWSPNQSPCEGMGTRQRTLTWNDQAIVVLATGPTETIQRAADHFSAFWVFREFSAAERITVNGSTVLGRTVSDLQSEIPGVTTFDSEIEGPLWTIGSEGIGGVSGGVSDGVTTSVRAGLFCID
jgi:hypothetical protein